jgi:hypothetical protein
MTVYIPSNLDIDNHIARFPTKTGAKPQSDYIAYTLSVIGDGLLFHKNKLAIDGFVPIYSALLKQLIGSDYNKYLGYLRRTRVIKRNKQYKVGKKSRGYIFSDEYLTELKPYNISNKLLIRKLKAYKSQESATAIRKIPYLYKWFKTGKLTIDKEGAETVLPEKYKTKLKKRKPNLSRKTKKEIADLAMVSWKLCIDKFHFKDYTEGFTVDESGGRLHTLLTRTSRSLRRFIKYDGKTLVHVDIANSQPYFAANLLDSGFWASCMLGKRELERISERIRKEVGGGDLKLQLESPIYTFKINKAIRIQIKYKEYLSLLMLLNKGKNESSIEFQRYKNIVSSGKFYDELTRLYGELFIKSRKPTKEEVKKWMFEILFSRNQIWLERPQTKLFRQTFPTVFTVFWDIKKHQYNTLALLLQNLESDAVLNHVCHSIARKHPDIPIFTIHDSVVTTLGNETIVKNIMGLELEKLTGLVPELKVKVWDETYDE